MKRQLLVGLMAGGMLVLLTTCGDNSSNKSNLISHSVLSGKITVGGSTTLQPLVQQASTKLMTKNPKVKISVQGGGSGVGLTQVSTGSFQIGNSDIFAEEKSGINAKKIEDNKVAVVGFSPIINADI